MAALGYDTTKAACVCVCVCCGLSRQADRAFTSLQTLLFIYFHSGLKSFCGANLHSSLALQRTHRPPWYRSDDRILRNKDNGVSISPVGPHTYWKSLIKLYWDSPLKHTMLQWKTWAPIEKWITSISWTNTVRYDSFSWSVCGEQWFSLRFDFL